MTTRKAIATAAISALVAGGGGAALAGQGKHGGQGGAKVKRSHIKRVDRHAIKQGLNRAGHAIHSESVVPAKDGTFSTFTFDRGTVTEVSGDQLSVKEGTKTATYKTVTLTIPADANIHVNGPKATLADVKAGQKVIVLQGPNHTLVAAHGPKPAPATP